MRILLVTPTPPGAFDGNMATARRWAGLLRQARFEALVSRRYARRYADLMVGLHALKSRAAVLRFRKCWPQSPVVVCLTGTDLYRDLPRNDQVGEVLEMADHLVVLQEAALQALPRRYRPKTRVIYQSAQPLKRPPARPADRFCIAVVGHLRPEKDPFRTAAAVRTLPSPSRVQVCQLGRAISGRMKERALKEQERNPRYRWMGEVSHCRARRAIAAAHLVSITSVMEGSSNVLSEALIVGTPVLASRIPGLIGTLGANYPGLFRVGDTRSLRRLIQRAENDQDFYSQLRQCCQSASHLVQPAAEERALVQLVTEAIKRSHVRT